MHSFKGTNNPAFIDGRTLIKHYCVYPECHNEISLKSACYGRGLCREHCWNKETKEKMSIASLGRIAWNKGLKNAQEPYWLGKSNKDVEIKHHIDGNKKNNNEDNFLKIKQGEHRSLHWRGYEYLVSLGLIKDYLKDFCIKYEIYDTKSYDGKVVHHIDCNRNNNNGSNFMYLKDKKIHNKLHQEAYLYLVRINRVHDYIDWFFLMKRENNQKSKVSEELK